MFERSYETGLLVQFLTKCVDDNRKSVISYEELGQAAGITITGCSHQLRTARKSVEQEKRVVFAVERGVGIKISRGDEQAFLATGAIEWAKKGASRRLRRLSCVRYDEMTNDAKVAHNVAASTMAAVRLVCRKKGQDKIEGAVRAAESRIPVSDMIKLFNGKQN